ncbi:Mur ligase family protein [Pseudogracilibacillus sp. SE30717A]|uniref:bifunctional folylpolyglutamate synthase/dihydrofolate synthase n=1 Tax=Pseudogracilibacillus sp. SE30717A TaxID=3098293 RepID=UPI00300E1C24
MFQSIEEIELFLEERNNLGIKPGLERVNYLLEELGNPEKKVATIHVAGTNGKGSTIQFINQALIANEYNVGIFTSPSFTGIRGHFIKNNSEMPKAEFIKLMNMLLPFVLQLDSNDMQPTQFEIITVLAFLYFKDTVDILLVETGMGGREDTTNCITPILSIITNVEKDHMRFLGKTYAEIASHKAGIIKYNSPVILGRVNEVSEEIIHKEAIDKSAALYQLGSEFNYDLGGKNKFVWETVGKKLTVELDMKGRHQMDNASLALMAIILIERTGLSMNWEKVLETIKKTKCPGRFETISDHPTIILDSAHNVAGIRAFLNTVQTYYPFEEKHLLFAGFKDKQLDEMLTELRKGFSYITITTFEHERAATLEDFHYFDVEYGDEYSQDWQETLQKIVKREEDQTLYFITGSLHFITLVREKLLNKKID